jgi:hypothetical protein
MEYKTNNEMKVPQVHNLTERKEEEGKFEKTKRRKVFEN